VPVRSVGRFLTEMTWSIDIFFLPVKTAIRTNLSHARRHRRLKP
jgi:hypothetical protein